MAQDLPTEARQAMAATDSEGGELSDAELANVTGGTENILNVGVVKAFLTRVTTVPAPSTPDTPTPVSDESKTFQKQK